jgi:hypothetical protein
MKSTQKGFISLLIVIIICIGVVAGSIVYYKNNHKDSSISSQDWPLQKNDQLGFEIKIPPTGLSSGISYTYVSGQNTSLESTLGSLNKNRSQQHPPETVKKTYTTVVGGRKAIINEILLIGADGSGIEVPKIETLIEMSANATAIIEMQGYQRADENVVLQKVTDFDYELLRKFNKEVLSTFTD